VSGILNLYRGTTYTAPTNVYLRVHTGDPGAAGTANASAETDRKQLTFAAPSGNAIAASQVSWTAWDAGSETISHFSIWDHATAGNFLQSGAFGASKAVSNGDTLNATITVSQTAVAA
jgi:hypothetical protein